MRKHESTSPHGMIPQTAEWRTLGMRAERLVHETRSLIAATNLALQESAKNLHRGEQHGPPSRSSRDEPGQPSHRAPAQQ